MENLIKQYVRKGTKQVGVLVGIKNEYGDVNIGWSKCTLRRDGKHVDTYDRDFGLQIALERATSPRFQKTVEIPYIVQKSLDAFKERTKRYFKTQKVNVHGEQPSL